MQINGFIDKGEFKKQINEWIRVFRNTKPAAGSSGPLIDPEREAEAVRSKEGIPLLNRWSMTCWILRKDWNTVQRTIVHNQVCWVKRDFGYIKPSWMI